MILDFDFVQEEGNTIICMLDLNILFFIQVLKFKNRSKYANTLCLLHPEHIVIKLLIYFTTLKV